jgi:hypothetical protein
MNLASHMDVLSRLRAQLEHFDRSPNFGDAAAVAAIRRHLLVRIREAESLMRSRFRAESLGERLTRSEAA